MYLAEWYLILSGQVRVAVIKNVKNMWKYLENKGVIVRASGYSPNKPFLTHLYPNRNNVITMI